MTRALRRALVLVVLAVLVLLVVADRLTESAAARALSVEARQTGLLAADPTVTIKGFPFLTQAFHGRYTEIDVTTHGIHRSGLRLDTVSGRFEGVHVGLRAALDGQVGLVRIDRATGAVEVTYADLNAYLAARHLSAAPTGDGTAVRLRGLATVAGRRVTVDAPVTLAVSASTLTVTPVAGQLRDPAGPLPAAVATAVGVALTVRITLAELPFGLQLQTVTATPLGLRLTAAARGLTVAVPADAAQTGVA